MNINADEALRAKDKAFGLMQQNKFKRALKYASKARELDPNVDKISQMIAVCQVHCAAQTMFEKHMDYYGILQIGEYATETTVKTQYKKHALLIHPDKNKFPGASDAFKLLGEAYDVAMDKQKRTDFHCIRWRCLFFEKYPIDADSSAKNTQKRKQKVGTSRSSSDSDSNSEEKEADVVILSDDDVPNKNKKQKQEEEVRKQKQEEEVRKHTEEEEEEEKTQPHEEKEEKPKMDERVGKQEEEEEKQKQEEEEEKQKQEEEEEKQKHEEEVIKQEEEEEKQKHEEEVVKQEEEEETQKQEEEEETQKQEEEEEKQKHEEEEEKQEEEEVRHVDFYDAAEFSDFDKLREERCFQANQIWAMYDAEEGMPRYYAIIKEVRHVDFKVQYAWLDVDQDNAYKRRNLPVSVGKFEVGDVDETNRSYSFSHLVCNTARRLTRGRKFTVIPKKGETWALFKNWDTLIKSTDPVSPSQYEYEFVEILSDQELSNRVSVGFLTKVEGFNSVFCPKGDSCEILPNEFCRFSHCIPSFRLKGTEGRGVSAGMYELDPAALQV